MSMDDHWLQNLTQTTAVIVPTRSLANTLKEEVADHYIAQGKDVWESINILLWQDYLKILWSHNRERVTEQNGARTLITARQSTMLWTQVVESSKRQEKALTLLNVQQTVRAVQRSWQLMNDWGISPDQFQEDKVADTVQFLEWIAEYRSLLESRGFMDESQLQQSLLSTKANSPYSKLIWCSYDLVSYSQKALNRIARESGCIVENLNASAKKSEQSRLLAGSDASVRCLQYATSQEELKSTFETARHLIETNPESKINIVIPDLQLRYALVDEIAREVFYPGVSPLECQRDALVYRFSLGKPLQQWPAIESALGVLKLLSNRTSVTELSFILRNRFIGLNQKFAHECRFFEQWLQSRRLRQINVNQLADLYQEFLSDSDASLHTLHCQELHEVFTSIIAFQQSLSRQLSIEKNDNGYSSLSFSDWVSVFEQWLQAWGWKAEVGKQSQHSVEYQLHARWQNLLEEFSGLSLVQNKIGLARALDLIRQMARDAIFQPQAVASPILISGVFEAIGRNVEHCFLLSMDQAYPVPPNTDAFVSNTILRERDYPNASAETSFVQAQGVISSLFSSATNKVVSYAVKHERDRDISNQVSPLFRNALFQPISTELGQDIEVPLVEYQDKQGPEWPQHRYVAGGTQIFQNQSSCAFRGFIKHRLGFLRADEAEFGLDHLDRGNIVHILLDVIWGKLQTQDVLIKLDEEQLQKTIHEVVEQVCHNPELELSEDKRQLLNFEKPRLRSLLLNWLALEKKRPIGFSVVEREESRSGEVGGIVFEYIVDRLDITDDGRNLIIDYKTGTANRKDWMGERLKSPQMPLYALCHDKLKRTRVAGISFAHVKSAKPDFIDLCEADILRPANATVSRREQLWEEHRARWPDLLENLADDFLQGAAQVNPIDEQTCTYCELQAVCRVSQLRQRTKAEPLTSDTKRKERGGELD